MKVFQPRSPKISDNMPFSGGIVPLARKPACTFSDARHAVPRVVTARR